MIRTRFAGSPVRATLCLAVLLIGLHARPARAGLVTVGTYTSSNVFPFGFKNYLGEYQEIYTNSAFSGPITITSVAFATSSFDAGAVGTVGFTLSLSTTPLSNLASPSTDYASNRGADFTRVFSGSKTFTAAGNGTFDFVVATAPFVYDPSKGALLVDVDITSSLTTNDSAIGFEANNDATTARVFNVSGTGPATVGTSANSTGLVTQFNTAPAAVPEPGSLAMLGLGLAGLGVARRLRGRR